MYLCRGWWIARFTFLLLAAAMAGCASDRFLVNVADVEIHVVDEQGRPLPDVIVWAGRRATPEPQYSFNTALGPQDVKRLLRRYAYCADLINNYNKPVSYLDILLPTDSSGDTEARVRVSRMDDWPSQMALSYAFIKRGYVPETRSFDIDRLGETHRLTVTMRPDGAQPVPPAYLDDYDRIRRRVAEIRDQLMERGPSLAPELGRLAQRLEGDAGQALEAGDKRAASHIYAFLQTMPIASGANGVTELAQVRQGPGVSVEWLKHARRLDPDSPYLKYQFLILRWHSLRYPYLQEKATPADRRAFDQWISDAKDYVARTGERAWPGIYLQLAISYTRMRDRHQRNVWLAKLRQFEPRL